MGGGAPAPLLRFSAELPKPLMYPAVQNPSLCQQALPLVDQPAVRAVMTIVSTRLRTTRHHYRPRTDFRHPDQRSPCESKGHHKETHRHHRCGHVMPIAARTSKELIEFFSVYDSGSTILTVEADKLLDLLETGEITAGAVKAFRQILLRLAGRNIWFCKLANIGTKREVGVDSRWFNPCSPPREDAARQGCCPFQNLNRRTEDPVSRPAKTGHSSPSPP